MPVAMEIHPAKPVTRVVGFAADGSPSTSRRASSRLHRSAEHRAPCRPNVPAVAETFPDFDAIDGCAFVTSAKTPEPWLDRWNTEIVEVLGTPDVRENLPKHAQTVDPNRREALGRFLVDRTTRSAASSTALP